MPDDRSGSLQVDRFQSMLGLARETYDCKGLWLFDTCRDIKPGCWINERTYVIVTGAIDKYVGGLIVERGEDRKHVQAISA